MTVCEDKFGAELNPRLQISEAQRLVFERSTYCIRATSGMRDIKPVLHSCYTASRDSTVPLSPPGRGATQLLYAD
jgi:hypothetical protein